MKFIPVLLCAALLSACNSAAMKAEDEYAFLSRNNVSKSELCAAATKAKQAWAERQNQDKYEHWKVISDLDCLSARMGI